MLRRLSKQKKIGIISLSSAQDPTVYQRGVEYLHSCGYELLCPLDPCANWGRQEHDFGSAPVLQRLKAFHELLQNEEVGAILLARGGYGISQLLPYLDYKEIARQQKPIIGFSDVTALLGALAKDTGMISIHGPTLSKLGDALETKVAQENAQALLELLQNPAYRPRMRGKIVRAGTATGKLIIGNLTMLLSLLGTPWDLDYAGAVLALEDVNEAPYRIHRAFLQLSYAGKLKNLSGLCLGQFSFSSAESDVVYQELVDCLVRDVLAKTSYPIIANCPFGHGRENIAWPFFSPVIIDGAEVMGAEQILF